MLSIFYFATPVGRYVLQIEFYVYCVFFDLPTVKSTCTEILAGKHNSCFWVVKRAEVK